MTCGDMRNTPLFLDIMGTYTELRSNRGLKIDVARPNGLQDFASCRSGGHKRAVA